MELMERKGGNPSREEGGKMKRHESTRAIMQGHTHKGSYSSSKEDGSEREERIREIIAGAEPMNVS